MESDTIAAIVTPPGEGGVGIVRTSGPLSRDLPPRLFPRLRPVWHSHHMRHGCLTDPETGQAVDEALGCFMRGPRSYTGEDVFEIHCHGSPLVLERVLAICLRQGCRGARPGEFTLRAFLAGRMDLSQAEAVLDVVRARTNAGLHLAVAQMSGWLGRQVEPVRQTLIGVLAHMEAMIDFVEDDIPPSLDTAMWDRLVAARAAIDTLLDGSAQGIILREGATLAIVGSPNVGKSSLMNALLGTDRSIVTPIAGTTRDTVEETVAIRGIPFRAVDTAGITNTDDPVERIGIERSHSALAAADVVLLVLDRSRALSPHDLTVIEAVHSAGEQRSEDGHALRVVVALNKSDCEPVLQCATLPFEGAEVVESSAVSPDGVDALRAALERAALGGQRGELVVSNVRHQEALRRAHGALSAAEQGLQASVPLDLLSFDVRAAANALGEITGVTVDDELLDRIFRDFCIGK